MIKLQLVMGFQVRSRMEVISVCFYGVIVSMKNFVSSEVQEQVLSWLRGKDILENFSS